MLVTLLEVPNTEYQTLQDNLQSAVEGLSTQVALLEESKQALKVLGPFYERANDERLSFFNEITQNIIEKFMEEFSDISQDDARRAVSPYQMTTCIRQQMDTQHNLVCRENGRQISHISSYKAAISDYKEQLDGMDSSPTRYNRDDIEVALRKVEGFIPGSVALSVEQGQYTLCWIMEGGQAKVNNLPMSDLPWFHVDELEVPYERHMIDIRLNTKMIKFIPDPGVETIYNWEGTRTVHPHILNDHIPCLGDFSGPMTEAIVECDWETVATLSRLFMSQIDSRDSAGSHWSHYFGRTFGERNATVRSRGSVHSPYGYKHYFKEDGKWIVKLSLDPFEFKPFKEVEDLEKTALTDAIRKNMENTFTDSSTQSETSYGAQVLQQVLNTEFTPA